MTFLMTYKVSALIMIHFLNTILENHYGTFWVIINRNNEIFGVKVLPE